MYMIRIYHIIPTLWDGQISLVHLQDGYSCTIAKKNPPVYSTTTRWENDIYGRSKKCPGPRGIFTMFQHMLDDLQLFLVRIAVKWGSPLSWWSFAILEFGGTYLKIIPNIPSKNRPKIVVSRKKSQPLPTW